MTIRSLLAHVGIEAETITVNGEAVEEKKRNVQFELPVTGKDELKQIGPRYNISSMWILDHDEGSHRRIIAGKEYIFRWVILDRVTTIVVSKREPGACTWSVEHVVEFPRKKS